MRALHLPLVTLLLVVAGLGLFLYKAVFLGFPLMPKAESKVWTLQARFTVDGDRRPVKADLQIPHGSPGFAILDENFISRGFGLRLQEREDTRHALWTARRASGRQTLYYRARISPTLRRTTGLPPAFPRPPVLEEPFGTALQTVVDDALDKSADAASLTSEILRRLNDSSPEESVGLLLESRHSVAGRAQVAVLILQGARVPARVAYAVQLEERQRRAAFKPWLEVHDGDRWLYFDPVSGEEGLPRDLFIWWRQASPLIEVRGASNPEVQISVWEEVASALEIAQRRAESVHSRVSDFSLLGLPIQTRAVYAVILLVPIGAFIMVLLRNLVGIKTFGTFMPILIALAFRETRLLWGLVLFSLVLALGLVLRSYLERLKLLMVPRLAAVLILVLLVLAFISVLSHRMGMESGLSVALFPVVILTMAIERLSIVWEERGAGEAFQEALGSLAVASIAYLVMNIDLVEHLVLVFPELLLLVLAATLLLGRYTGYRLLELVRFRTLA